MDDLAKTTIKRLLKDAPQVESFLARLESFVQELNHPANVCRRPMLKPRSKEKEMAVRRARKLANRLGAELNDLRGVTLDLDWEDTKNLIQWQDHLPEFEATLRKAADQARPRRKDKRLYFQRYALRGLMWLFAQYLPELTISSTPSSQFYQVAGVMLQQIRYYRDDIREPIREEIQRFLETVRTCPPADYKMGMIVIEH